jgi:hypothetical protein
VIYLTRRPSSPPAPTTPPRVEEPAAERPKNPLESLDERLNKAVGGLDRVVEWSRNWDVVKKSERVQTPVPDGGDAWATPGSKPDPAAKPGTLTITSTPLATIYVDGVKLGDTPLRGQSLAPGTHELKAVLATGRERTMPIHISSGEETDAGTLTW